MKIKLHPAVLATLVLMAFAAGLGMFFWGAVELNHDVAWGWAPLAAGLIIVGYICSKCGILGEDAKELVEKGDFHVDH